MLTAQAAQTETAMPDLGRLKAAAERIGAISAEVDAFLFRFRGPRGGESSGAAIPQPPDTYRNDIDSLFSQIEHLDTLAAQLRDIG